MACINKLNEILLAFYVSNCWHILNWICKEKKEDENAWDILIILAVASARFYRRAWSFCCFFFLNWNIDDDLIYVKTKQRWIFVVRLIYFLCFFLFLFLSFRFVSLFYLRVIHGCCAAHWGEIVAWGAEVHYWPRHGTRADRRHRPVVWLELCVPHSFDLYF